MAYRFLLSVPKSLQEDANIVINAVDDAQVVLSRNSHGLGFDDPFVDFTVAAHSLTVIDAIYAWFADLGADHPSSRTNMRIVLHSGDRVSLQDVSHRAMVALIRRDQPWVERSIPKIGEHETKQSPGTSVIETSVVAREPSDSGATTAVAEPIRTNLITILAADKTRAREGMTVAGVPQVVIKVYDLAKPEQVYGELFGTEMIGRGNHRAEGGWEFLPPAYDHEQEAQDGTEPEYAFLQNGPLSIALERQGRGYPLDGYAIISEPIHLALDMQSLSRVRALVLMRSYNVLDSCPDAFAFRDPFGYSWTLVGHAEEGYPVHA